VAEFILVMGVSSSCHPGVCCRGAFTARSRRAILPWPQ
jgi:hypothetical protein